jgi:hypothetical protein
LLGIRVMGVVTDGNYTMIRYIIRSFAQLALCFLGILLLTALCILIAGDWAVLPAVGFLVAAVVIDALFARQ